MHVTTLISAVITLAGALVVLAWMPGRRAASAAETVQDQPEQAAVRARAERDLAARTEG